MKVLTFYKPGDMRLEERSIPHAGANQLVVKINYVGVCGTDVEFYAGHIPPFIHLPMIPGHENTGTVVEVGEGVTGFQVGDRLICGPPSTCKEMCPSCRKGKTNICLNSFPQRTAGFGNLDGGFSEYLLIHDVAHTSLVKIPDNVDLKDAVLFDVICVALHALRISRFKAGDNVVVSGPGSVGLSMIQFLKAGGANKIIVLGAYDESVQIAMQYGGDYFINAVKSKDIPRDIKKILDSDVCADMAFECAGNPASYLNCITCIRPGGQMVCVGTISEPVTLIPSHFSPMEFDFQYSFVYTKEEIKMYMDMLASKKVGFPGMVTGVFSMEDVVEKYIGAPMASRKEHLKVLIDPGL
ncbi:MAG: alcohol dehydrogenase catalytic domain-containing protein [Treponema sp.]|jgi:2-desacetyl-2-hydroxyethyl bacteriochlorophyllide A dehydrogenase|nr:alcohol dehydrogenase catalytic domain-containing protein [Treponema sp.]